MHIAHDATEVSYFTSSFVAVGEIVMDAINDLVYCVQC